MDEGDVCRTKLARHFEKCRLLRGLQDSKSQKDLVSSWSKLALEYFVQDFTNSIQMACVGPAGFDHKFGNEAEDGNVCQHWQDRSLFGGN